LDGIEVMQKNRDVKDLHDLTNGPGKLTEALAITRELNGVGLTKKNSQLVVVEGKSESLQICSSHRIGVKTDLPQKLRFFVRESKFVSRFS